MKQQCIPTRGGTVSDANKVTINRNTDYTAPCDGYFVVQSPATTGNNFSELRVDGVILSSVVATLPLVTTNAFVKKGMVLRWTTGGGATNGTGTFYPI